LEFGLRPSPSGPSTHVALRAERERKLGHVISARRIYDDKDIVVAGCEIDFLNFNAHLFRQFLRGLSSLRGVFD
jgi:hypothetical protein